MGYLISLCGLLVVLALALLVSKNKKEIKYKNIIVMLITQFLLATDTAKYNVRLCAN